MMQADKKDSGSGLQEAESVRTDLMRAAMLPEQQLPHSNLYIVGLPIGNAADITLRALWVLAHADTIACEDTRETRKLLERYDIRSRTVAVHQHNEAEAAPGIIALLEKGERVALVTDAGTPAVSDPGAKVVKAVREAGYRVTPIPGASAAVTALSAAGFDSYSFSFAGFLPHGAKARREAVASWAGRGEAFVIYEAPHRIRALAGELAAALDPGRRVMVARELTKKFETIEVMAAGDLAAWAESHEPRGEYVVAVDEAPAREAEIDEAARKWLDALAGELPAGRAAAVAAKAAGLPRDVLYRYFLERS